jgi:5-methylcytosine-specific restriction endonuclease McrA
MVTIITRKSKAFIVQHIVPENPTPGTYADYILMKNELLKKDDRWTSLENQAVFNMNFLKKMRDKYEKLHCVYCNKQDLRIYEFHEKFNSKDGATTDHILPVADYPHLAKEQSNCTVSCSSCNRKKDRKLQKIIYPYK